MDPDAVPPDVLRSSVVQRRYDAYNRLQGVSRCLNARPGAPRDSAPAAVYVVFGPALKKLWKLVMALPTSRYGSKVSRNLGGFYRNNETKFGWVSGETLPGGLLKFGSERACAPPALSALNLGRLLCASCSP